MTRIKIFFREGWAQNIYLSHTNQETIGDGVPPKGEGKPRKRKIQKTKVNWKESQDEGEERHSDIKSREEQTRGSGNLFGKMKP